MDRFSYKTDKEYEEAVKKESSDTDAHLDKWCKNHPEEKECLIYED